MTAQDSKSAGLAQLAPLDLPEDLRGRIFRLPDFATEENCAWFFPRRSLQFHRRMNTAIAREIRRRGGKVQRFLLDPALFPQSLSPQGRYTAAQEVYALLPLSDD